VGVSGNCPFLWGTGVPPIISGKGKATDFIFGQCIHSQRPSEQKPIIFLEKREGSRPEATSLPPSILLSSFPSQELPKESGLDGARSPAVKPFDAICAVKQPYIQESLANAKV